MLVQVRQFNEQIKQGTDIQSVVLSDAEAAPSGPLDNLIARYTVLHWLLLSLQPCKINSMTISGRPLSII